MFYIGLLSLICGLVFIIIVNRRPQKGGIENGLRGSKRNIFPGYYSIEDHVPYVQAVGPYVQDRYGATHQFYEIKGPSLESLETDRLLTIRSSLVGLLQSLPDSIKQLQYSFSTTGEWGETIAQHAEYVCTNSQIPDFMRTERAKYLEEESNNNTLVRSENHLAISYLPSTDATKIANMVTSGSITMPEVAVTLASTKAAHAVLKISKSLVEETMTRCGIGVNSIAPKEVVKYLYRLYNPHRRHIPVVYDDNITPFNDAWLAEDWEILPEGIKIGNTYHGIVSLNSKPLSSRPRIIEQLTTGSGIKNIRVVMTIRKISREAQLAELKSIRSKAVVRRKEPLSILTRLMAPQEIADNYSQRFNVEMEAEINESNELISTIRAGEDFLVSTQLVAHTWANSIEELEEAKALLTARINDMNSARGVAEGRSSYFVTRSALPGSIEPLPRSIKMQARMAADMTPIGGIFEGGDKPVALFKNVHDGLVSIDLYSNRLSPAPLTFISGASGTGKSVLTNHLVLQHMVDDTAFLCIDVGGSYTRLVEVLGGKTISFTAEKPFCFNPLQIYASTTNGIVNEPTPAERSKLARAVEAMIIRKDEAALPSGMLQEIDAAIQQVFARASSQGQPYVTFSNLLQRIISVPQRDESMTLHQDLALRLKPFCQGETYGDWFDGPTNIEMGDNCIYFDLKGVRKDTTLSAAMLPNLINFIGEWVMKTGSKRKIIVMDEMWEFICNEGLMNFIVEAWKTFRKEGALVIGVSQNLGADIASNPIVAGAIVQNTQNWFLLPQGQSSQIKETAKLLGMTEGEEEMLNHLDSQSRIINGKIQQWRTAMMIRGAATNLRESGRIRIASTPREYWLTTTNPDERQLFETTKIACDGNVLMAIDTLARKYPGGLSLEKNT